MLLFFEVVVEGIQERMKEKCVGLCKKEKNRIYFFNFVMFQWMGEDEWYRQYYFNLFFKNVYVQRR